MIWIGWRRIKVETFIKEPGLVVLGVDGKGANTRDIGGLQRTQHRIFKKPCPKSLALPWERNGEAGEQHDGNRMAREAQDAAREGRMSDAQKQMAQLEKMLAAADVKHREGTELVRQLGDIELTQRLTDVARDRICANLHLGPQATLALQLVADQSAFLDPPAGELPANGLRIDARHHAGHERPA